MKKSNGLLFACALVALPLAACAETVVNVTGVGAEKISVALGIPQGAYQKSLRKNLELSGLFVVAADGAVKVTGQPGGEVRATGRGKGIASTAAVTDDRSARMAARRFADEMVAAWSDGRQKGFACDPIAFVNRKGADNAELCTCYPDGYDIRQITADRKATVGPRWKDTGHLYYTGFLQSGPQVYEIDVATGRRKLVWSLKGLTTGAVVSPDGSRVAVIASFQGNPELYIFQGGRYERLTNTPNASEGQPAWSPDGRQIVYVSDETRHPQLYVIDVATKKSRRITSKGSQNVDPDWGRDGRITYITRRGGAYVAVMHPADGEAQAKLVTAAGNWEHPSWSRDGRNLVASRDKALFVVDTQMEDDRPNAVRPIFNAPGNWITPSWYK